MAPTQGLLPDALFKFDHLGSRVQAHLKRVYSTLAISMLTASAGAYINIMSNLMFGGIFTALGSMGLMLWLASTRHSKETEIKRLGIFAAFTFTSGMSLGPLLDHVIMINPSIIVTALMGTCLIFGCFSLASLYNTNRMYLYMGGFLLSALSWLCLAGFLNIFFRSKILYDVSLYGGLVLFCAFVLYDTQLIVEKARNGDYDYIWHSVDLFLDFIHIFQRLLIILSNKEGDKKKKRN